jgi:putative phosphoesterase
VVSDIHCNAQGLLAALAAMGPVERLLCLGDSINESLFSNEVVALLRERGAEVIRGNHEEVFFSSAGERARERSWIDADHLQWLQSRPARVDLDVGGRRIVMVHSTPWFPSGDYVYPHSAELRRFGEVEADYVLYGHTHVQMVRNVGRPLVVNPGSAGQRRNGLSLSCAVLELETGGARIVEYDLPGEMTGT